jgi:transcriptional regulator with XRE-family HTH domain
MSRSLRVRIIDIAETRQSLFSTRICSRVGHESPEARTPDLGIKSSWATSRRSRSAPAALPGTAARGTTGSVPNCPLERGPTPKPSGNNTKRDEHPGDQQRQALLGDVLSARRSELGWSLRQVGDETGIDFSHFGTIEKNEKRPSAYDLNVTDLYSLAGYTEPTGLPALQPYLRAKYDLPHGAVDELDSCFGDVKDKYGVGDDTKAA